MFDPEVSFSSLDAKERNACAYVLRSFAQQVEAQFFQYRAKLLEPEVWNAHITVFASFLEFPAVAEWWRIDTTLPIYTDSFLQCVASTERVALNQENVTGAGRSGDARIPQEKR